MAEPRVHVDMALVAGEPVRLDPRAQHYLVTVLRKTAGDHVILFNGRDGDWRAELIDVGKRAASVRLIARIAPQTAPPDLHYCFAPLKHARQDYMAQKAVELGAAVLRPVITARTMAQRVRLDKLRANVVEASEQCGVPWVSEVREPVDLARLLAGWDADRALIFCDERAAVADPVSALSRLEPGPVGVIVGPEGGFTEDERQRLLAHPSARAISLGPRILRADTAAIAALTLVQAVLGDWRAQAMRDGQA